MPPTKAKNINIATKPLKIATYLAPTIPMEVLKKTAKGSPWVWQGFPIKFDKKTTSKEAVRVAKKTTTILISYTKYKEAIKANPIIL